MKVAIVHDELMRRGGAENVVRVIHEMYPESTIYTLAYRPNLTYPEFKDIPIKTSWFQFFALNESFLKALFFPLGIFAMKSLMLKDYDLVIVSTTHCGKYVKVSPNAKVITYCYTPFRLVWNPKSYTSYTQSKGLKRFLFDWVIKIIRKIDFDSAQRTDHFVAMTDETKERILRCYEPKNPIKLINPPVNTKNYEISIENKGYYLIVSRLEPYKMVNLAVEAFSDLDKKLVVVGRGSQKEKLRKIASKNIEFLEGIPNEELSKLYSNCKAFIFPQEEDYGITPLEANAAGKPVIAYCKGGVNDTMVPYESDMENATALFFEEQSKESLVDAILRFEDLSFNPEVARLNAEKFSEANFKVGFKKIVDDVMK